MNSSIAIPAQPQPWKNSLFSLPKKPSHLALSGEYLRGQAPVFIAARHRLRRESAPGGAVQHRPLMRPQLNASGFGAERCCCPDGSTHARLSHVDPCGLVDDAVHDRLGRDIGTEPGMPVLLPVLGAEDRRPLVVAELEDLEQC